MAKNLSNFDVEYLKDHDHKHMSTHAQSAAMADANVLAHQRLTTPGPAPVIVDANVLAHQRLTTPGRHRNFAP